MLNDRHDPLDEAFKALADPHRRRILAAVCESPMAAGDLARLVRLAPNALSFHLKWLKSAGLVAAQRRGKFLHYHPIPSALANWRSHVNSCFNGAGTPAVSTTPPRDEKPRIPRQRRGRSLQSRTVFQTASADAFREPPLPTELL